MNHDSNLDREDVPTKTEPPNDAHVKSSKSPKLAESTGLEVLSEEVLASLDPDELKGDVAALEGVWDICVTIALVLQHVAFRVERVKNSKPNMGLLEEYRKREAEFLDRAKDLEDTTTARDAAKTNFDQLRKQRLDEFMSGFNAISGKLKEMYQVSLSLTLLSCLISHCR